MLVVERFILFLLFLLGTQENNISKHNVHRRQHAVEETSKEPATQRLFLMALRTVSAKWSGETADSPLSQAISTDTLRPVFGGPGASAIAPTRPVALGTVGAGRSGVTAAIHFLSHV